MYALCKVGSWLASIVFGGSPWAGKVLLKRAQTKSVSRWRCRTRASHLPGGLAGRQLTPPRPPPQVARVQMVRDPIPQRKRHSRCPACLSSQQTWLSRTFSPLRYVHRHTRQPLPCPFDGGGARKEEAPPSWDQQTCVCPCFLHVGVREGERFGSAGTSRESASPGQHLNMFDHLGGGKARGGLACKAALKTPFERGRAGCQGSPAPPPFARLTFLP